MVEKEKSSRRWSMAPGVARRPAAMPEPAKDGAGGGGGAEEAVAGVEDDFAVGAEVDEQVARVEVGLVESGGEVAADEGGDGGDGEDGGVGGDGAEAESLGCLRGEVSAMGAEGRVGPWGGRVDAPEERGHGGVAGDGESRGWRCAVVELVDELVDGGGDGLLELCSAVGGGRRGRCAR